MEFVGDSNNYFDGGLGAVLTYEDACRIGLAVDLQGPKGFAGKLEKLLSWGGALLPDLRSSCRELKLVHRTQFSYVPKRLFC